MIEIDFLPVPIDVIIGFICIVIFGFLLGAIIYLPIAHQDSTLSLDKLSNDLIWRYVPDWIICIICCIVFLSLGFMLVSGIWRIL